MKYIKLHYAEAKVVVFINAYTQEQITEKCGVPLALLEQSVDEVLSLKTISTSDERWLLGFLTARWPGNNIFSRAWNRMLGRLFRRYIDTREERYAERILSRVMPDVFIRDTGADWGIRGQILTRAMRDDRIYVIVIPHGSDLVMLPSVNQASYEMKGHVHLCPSDSIRRYYESTGRLLPKEVVGNPRYDKWWIQFMAERGKEFYQTADIPDKRIILFITRGPHPEYLSKDNFTYIVKETMREVLRLPDTFVCIRPHPRQSRLQLESILSKFDRDRWQINVSDVFCYSNQVPVAISMWSSMILDCLAAGVPVIEFYRFEGSSLKWLKDKTGHPTTHYRADGLALGADTGRDLSVLLRKFIEDGSTEKNEQQRRFRRLVPDSYDKATRDVADVVMRQWNLQNVH